MLYGRSEVRGRARVRCRRWGEGASRPEKPKSLQNPRGDGPERRSARPRPLRTGTGPSRCLSCALTSGSRGASGRRHSHQHWCRARRVGRLRPIGRSKSALGTSQTPERAELRKAQLPLGWNERVYGHPHAFQDRARTWCTHAEGRKVQRACSAGPQTANSRKSFQNSWLVVSASPCARRIRGSATTDRVGPLQHIVTWRLRLISNRIGLVVPSLPR